MTSINKTWCVCGAIPSYLLDESISVSTNLPVRKAYTYQNYARLKRILWQWTLYEPAEQMIKHKIRAEKQINQMKHQNPLLALTSLGTKCLPFPYTRGGWRKMLLPLRKDGWCGASDAAQSVSTYTHWSWTPAPCLRLEKNISTRTSFGTCTKTW